MTMKSISLFRDNGSWLIGVHPFTKLLYILTAIAVPLLWGGLWAFAAAICASGIILASARLLNRALPLLTFSLTLIVVIFLIHGLFSQKNVTPLFTLGFLHFYREGTLYALRISLNIINMLLSFAVLVLSTNPCDLVEELEKHGFSTKFSYIVNSVFQIIPQMSGTMSTITDAQRSRGMETEGKLLTRARAFLPLISPVVMSSLINTRERAIALEVRGFGAKRKKTYLADRTISAADRVIVPLLLLCIVAAAVRRVLLCL